MLAYNMYQKQLPNQNCSIFLQPLCHKNKSTTVTVRKQPRIDKLLETHLQPSFHGSTKNQFHICKPFIFLGPVSGEKGSCTFPMRVHSFLCNLRDHSFIVNERRDTITTCWLLLKLKNLNKKN